MTFKPLHDLVVVDRDEIETVTPGGLLLPNGSLQKPQTGRVISVGKDVTGVAPGDKIFYSNRAGTTVKVDGEEVFFVKEENIIGVFDE